MSSFVEIKVATVSGLYHTEEKIIKDAMEKTDFFASLKENAVKMICG